MGGISKKTILDTLEIHLKPFNPVFLKGAKESD